MPDRQLLRNEIARLMGELEACHKAFREGQSILKKLREQTCRQETALTECKRQIAAQEVRIVDLEGAIRESEPKLAVPIVNAAAHS